MQVTPPPRRSRSRHPRERTAAESAAEDVAASASRLDPETAAAIQDAAMTVVSPTLARRVQRLDVSFNPPAAVLRDRAEARLQAAGSYDQPLPYGGGRQVFVASLAVLAVVPLPVSLGGVSAFPLAVAAAVTTTVLLGCTLAHVLGSRARVHSGRPAPEGLDVIALTPASALVAAGLIWFGWYSEPGDQGRLLATLVVIGVCTVVSGSVAVIEGRASKVTERAAAAHRESRVTLVADEAAELADLHARTVAECRQLLSALPPDQHADLTRAVQRASASLPGSRFHPAPPPGSAPLLDFIAQRWDTRI